MRYIDFLKILNLKFHTLKTKKKKLFDRNFWLEKNTLSFNYNTSLKIEIKSNIMSGKSKIEKKKNLTVAGEF